MEHGEPQDEFSARSLWPALFERLLERSRAVFWLAHKARDTEKTYKNLGKTVVFTHTELLRMASARARKNFEK